MAARKRGRPTKRRGPRHPGVVLVKPNAARRSGWLARYKDPDSGRTRHESLPAELTTLEQREDWAVDKSKKLARRRMEIEGGAPRATGTSLEDAIKRYFDAHAQLRERTRAIYRAAADKLEAWAERARVRSADDLNRAKLMAFRVVLISEPKRAPGAGEGTRWKFAPTAARRAPVSVNQELRALRTVLGYVHDLDLLPRLSRDDLRRALKMLKAEMEAPEFLRPHELQQLFEAALRHDDAKFKITKEEHAGLRPVGTTPRYTPIAPFLAAVLLCGFRASEALELKWSDVDLNALDADGNVVGEIRLRAGATKTARARVVGLDVCPELRKMLAAMKLRAGEATYVFGGKAPMSRALAEGTRKRLVAEFRAPKFSWQLLRSTCATFQCNAPSLWGTAAPFVSAKRLGHAVAVSERVYAGQLAVSREARTLEAAMQIEDVMARVLERVGGAKVAKPRHARGANRM